MSEMSAGAIYGITQSEVNEFLKAPGAIGGTTPAAGTFTSVTTDTINERTSAAGVTIDSVLLKDGRISLTPATGAAQDISIIRAKSDSIQQGPNITLSTAGYAQSSTIQLGADGDLILFNYQPSTWYPTVYLFGPNVGIGTKTFGTSASKVLAIASGTAPTTSPADAAQMWVADRGAVAGDAALHMRDEVGTNGPVAFATQKVITQAATDTLTLNEVMGTVISNYGQAAENTQTLPAAAAGLNGRVSISTTGAGAFHLKAGAGDKIYKDGSALDDGDKVSLAAPAIGDCFSFWAIQTGAAAYDWCVVSGVGLLIDGGA